MSRSWQRRLLPLLAGIPLAIASGCSSAPSAAKSTSSGAGSSRRATATFPVTIHAAGGLVRIAHRPTAIVSLSPSATEMLYAIGAGPQVKAVDEFSDYPPNAPRTKLDGLEPNVEAIASYKPDLVVISNDIAGIAAKLNALGIPVLDQPAPIDLAEDYTEYSELGAATGRTTAAAQEVAKIKHSIATIAAGVPHHAGRLTYYYEIGLDPYYSVTDSTFVGSLLSLLGLRSIADAAKGAAASGGYPELNAEYIVHSNPDYIFLADTLCCHQSAATVAARPGWSHMSAVTGHRILGLNDDIASRWGPRIVILLSQVAAELERHKVG
jgi:iron complex transport system substrate-binding protein